ncbi:ribonuclease P protein component [Canibacter zhoujuaniae]|uniref:ribonuclease P protein component n=1 Tax=Canibacter zhoujuaniae TaxID=2708343 RepID=UPI0014224E8E|nr:ribonuclease P protein component [Canibacter zhoujuaniae]
MAGTHRIKRGEDYRRIVRSGYRVGGRLSLAHAVLLSPETPSQFGFIISKTVGNAVTRNRVRRRLKEICYQSVKDGFSGAAVVFRVFPGAAEASFQELENAIRKQLERLDRDLIDASN